MIFYLSYSRQLVSYQSLKTGQDHPLIQRQSCLNLSLILFPAIPDSKYQQGAEDNSAFQLCMMMTLREKHCFQWRNMGLRIQKNIFDDKTSIQWVQSLNSDGLYILHILIIITTMAQGTNWNEYSCLHPKVISVLKKNGMPHPTLIQSEVFSCYTYHHDFLIAAQTGSGKTLAFAAPILSELQMLKEANGFKHIPKTIMALILTPTHELAQQTHKAIQMVLESLNQGVDYEDRVNVNCLIGGLSKHKQIRTINTQRPQIVIGTPGRIQQMLDDGDLSFDFIKFLVIDEADRMIEMGHFREIDQILERIFLPKKPEYFDKDFQKVKKQLDEKTIKEDFFIKQSNGKKMKLSFYFNDLPTDQLFQVPAGMFQIAGVDQVKVTTKLMKGRKPNKQKQKKKGQQQNQDKEDNGNKETNEKVEKVKKIKKKKVKATLNPRKQKIEGTQQPKKNKKLKQTSLNDYKHKFKKLTEIQEEQNNSQQNNQEDNEQNNQEVHNQNNNEEINQQHNEQNNEQIEQEKVQQHEEQKNQNDNPEAQNQQQKKQQKLSRRLKKTAVPILSKEQIAFLQRLKRKVFFVSATLTRQFSDTKYFIKRPRSQEEWKKLKKQRKQKKKIKEQGGTDKKSKGKDNYNNEEKQIEQTIPKLKALLSRVQFSEKPKVVDLSSLLFLPTRLVQRLIYTEGDLQRLMMLICYLKELPVGSKTIIFSNTIKACKRIQYFIQAFNMPVINMHSLMDQHRRSRKISKFKDSTLCNIMVATDVIARGVDFTVTHVVQVGVPINGDTYVHRAGRTARAGRSGEALILVDKKEVNRWNQISDTISAASPNRKVGKYSPHNKLVSELQPKMENLEWIRRNTEARKTQKRLLLDKEDAENLGVELEDEAPRKKYDLDREEEEMVRHQVKQKISILKSDHLKQPQRPEGEKWRKNKLVLTPQEMKRYL